MFEGTRVLPCKGAPSGFTLLEVVLALAILSGLVVAVLTSLNEQIRAVDRVRAVTTATMLARERAEEISMYGIPNEVEGDFAPRFTDYRWDCRTEELGVQGIRKIYITVKGNGERVVIETYRLSG